MRKILLIASLLGAVASPVAAQPRHHGARHLTTSFQAYAPGAFDRGTGPAAVAAPLPQATGEYPCIWGALGRC